jgi:ABC-type glycerol-3-phosphate transport system substrate-binding protein
MGKKLGIAMLPNTPAGKARPFLNVRTWFFGSQSSGRQHESAKKFALFSINIVQQRNMALKTGTVVPVNPGISLPLKTNKDLKLVNVAADKGKLLTLGQVDWLYRTDTALISFINPVLSGEQSPEEIAPRLDNLLEYGARK